MQNLVARELHPVRLQGVPLHAGDELRFIVGADLETAVAVKYRSMHHLGCITSAATLGRGCKQRASCRQEDG